MESVVKEILWEKWKDIRVPQTDDDDDGEAYEDKINKENLGPMLVGPMGIIPLNDQNLPGKNYNFWILHTNFPFDEIIFKTIDDFPGVEVFDVFTPYRARIAIGRLFDEDEVKDGLEKALGANKNE